MTTMVTNHQWKWQHFHGFQHLSKQNAQQYVYVWIAWLNKFSYSIVIEHIETIVPLKKFRFHLGYDWVLGVLRKTFSLLHTAASLFFVIIRSSTNLFIQFILKIKKRRLMMKMRPGLVFYVFTYVQEIPYDVFYTQSMHFRLKSHELSF